MVRQGPPVNKEEVEPTLYFICRESGLTSATSLNQVEREGLEKGPRSTTLGPIGWFQNLLRHKAGDSN